MGERGQLSPTRSLAKSQPGFQKGKKENNREQTGKDKRRKLEKLAKNLIVNSLPQLESAICGGKKNSGGGPGGRVPGQNKGIIFALHAKIIVFFPAVFHVKYTLGESKEIYRGTEQKIV